MTTGKTIALTKQTLVSKVKEALSGVATWKVASAFPQCHQDKTIQALDQQGGAQLSRAS